MVKLFIIILNSIIGLRTLTGVSSFDFGGYGNHIYFVIMSTSLLYFIYRIFASLKKGKRKEAFVYFGSILLIIGGVAASALALIFILNYFPK